MINTNPFKRTLIEREVSIPTLSQLTGITEGDLYAFEKGYRITKHNVETICKILKCQPCDILEFTKEEKKGHWEWVADSGK